MNRVHIVTLGCKLNQFETEAIVDNLIQSGFKIVPDLEQADYVIVHTCTVTNKADAKSRQMMRKAKREGKQVIAAGCLATTDNVLLNRQEYIDLVVDNIEKFSMGDILHSRKQHEEHSIFPLISTFEKTRGMIKIQEGCDKFCSYCKIPYARGKSVSADPELLIEQARQLIKNGYKELVLTGVNISDYHYDEIDLGALTRRIAGITGEFRIRWSSLQPDEINDKWLDLLNHPRFAPHFHLSLQSGSDSVLKRMNRHYTSADFLKTVDAIRKEKPDCGITTDIIVGFPDESDSEFQETLELVEKVEFSRAHIFTYSPRANTPAAKMKNLHGNLKREREKELRQVSQKFAEKFTRREVLGNTQKVLIEKIENGLAEGYTGNYYRLNSGATNCEVNHFYELIPTGITVTSDGVVEVKT